MDIAKGIEGKLVNGSANPKDFKKLNGKQVDRGNWGYAKLQLDQGYRNKDYDIQAESKTYLGELEPTTDLAKQWQGWGSCLKPAFEPIIIARKPFKGSLVDNVIKWGVGGLNIDECRVGEIGATKKNLSNVKVKASMTSFGGGQFYNGEVVSINQGRFPANLILTYEQMTFDEVCGGFPDSKGFYRPNCKDKSYNQSSNIKLGGGNVSSQYNDSGSACRYFYCAKASKKDRDEGLDGFEYYELNENIDEEIKNNIKRLLSL